MMYLIHTSNTGIAWDKFHFIEAKEIFIYGSWRKEDRQERRYQSYNQENKNQTESKSGAEWNTRNLYIKLQIIEISQLDFEKFNW